MMEMNIPAKNWQRLNENLRAKKGKGLDDLLQNYSLPIIEEGKMLEHYPRKSQRREVENIREKVKLEVRDDTAHQLFDVLLETYDDLKVVEGIASVFMIVGKLEKQPDFDQIFSKMRSLAMKDVIRLYAQHPSLNLLIYHLFCPPSQIHRNVDNWWPPLRRVNYEVNHKIESLKHPKVIDCFKTYQDWSR